jgi:hypothetical protein
MRRGFLTFIATFLLVFSGLVPAHAVLLDLQVSLGANSQSFAKVLFAKQTNEGHDVLTYVVAISRDAKATWVEHNVSASSTDAVVNVQLQMPAASAAFVKVASVDNGVRSNWSNEVVAVTKGLRAQRVYIKTYSGAPISGGAVSWVANSGRTRSSVQYGLTSTGYIDFPALPAGSATVSLVNGELPDGTRVSGVFNAFLGFEPTTLTTPNPPMSVRTLTVQLPNGVPVANAAVTVDSSYLSSSIDLQGFTFSIPDTSGLSVSEDYYTDDWIDPWDTYSGSLVTSGLTDNLGRFTVVGFTNTVPPVSVEYNDGFITQTVTGQLSNYNTIIELDYEPYVDVLQSAVLVDNGSTASIPIDVTTGDPSVPARIFPLPFGASAILPAIVGPTTISLLRPSGASVGRCGATGSTSLSPGGTGTIRICATKSGVYRIRTGAGIMTTGKVTLHVKNSAPMAPTKVKVATAKLGSAILTWDAPEYGGNSVVKYVITVKRGSSVLKTITTTSRTLSFNSLPRTANLKFIVKAVNKFGISDAVQVSSKVA